MRFKASDLGKIVRPKTITHLLLWNKQEHSNISEWWKDTNYYYRWKNSEKKQQLIEYYRKNLDNIFLDLKIGNTADSKQQSYVAKIVGFVVLNKGTYTFINDQEKLDKFEQELKKKFGPNCFLPVAGVALTFYKDFEINAEGIVKPKEPWIHTNDNNIIWLYQSKDIVPFENILLFEKLEPGDLVELKKTKGMVVKSTILGKPKFYSSNSSVVKSVVVLTVRITKIKLQPTKKYNKL